MTSSANQIRAWTGPQILGYGFRPFFLGAAVFAAFAMIAWIGALSGLWTIPSAFGPVEWHVHEFLWGYLSAVTAGFMLTAVPNWTGRLPIVGVPLAALWATWALGRIAVFFSAGWPPAVIAILDLSFLALLILVLSREIAAGRNWRNLKVLALVAMLLLGNAIYHAEMMAGVMAHDSDGLRIGLASAVLMIAVIGGRIIPSFTRNWLARRGPGAVPEPFGIDDKIVIAVTAVALLLWVVTPHYVTTALALLAARSAISGGCRAGWAGAPLPSRWWPFSTLPTCSCRWAFSPWRPPRFSRRWCHIRRASTPGLWVRSY